MITKSYWYATISKGSLFVKESSIAQIQQMLEEEASEGWYFVEKKGYTYYFKKDKAKKLKFRLLPNTERLSNKEIGNELLRFVENRIYHRTIPHQCKFGRQRLCV